MKNTAVLAECLPQSTCKKLAAIWNLDQNACNQLDAYLCKYLESQKQEENRIVDEYIKNVEKDMGIRSEVSEDLQVEPGSEEK